jgi:hypothetical protein
VYNDSHFLKLQRTLTVYEGYILKNSWTVKPQYVKQKRFLYLQDIAVSSCWSVKSAYVYLLLIYDENRIYLHSHDDIMIYINMWWHVLKKGSDTAMQQISYLPTTLMKWYATKWWDIFRQVKDCFPHPVHILCGLMCSVHLWFWR